MQSDTDLQKQFEEKGYVVLKGIISAEDTNRYIQALKELGRHKKKDTWTIPDGVVQHDDFWPILIDRNVVDRIKVILGPEIKVMQHNDLHLGYSSFAWHRDGINRSYRPEWPEWQESEAPYKIVRCGFYFQPEENNFHLGVLPGSHKPNGYLSREDFLLQNEYLSNVKNAKAKLGLKDLLKEKADWIKTGAGDCIVFDPRLIHTGGEFSAHKYSVFTAYGIPNIHFKEHYTYYRHLRYDLGYRDFSEQLAAKLKAVDLYFEEKKYFDEIEGAWVPSKLYSMVSRLFT